MVKTYSHLTNSERLEIEILYGRGYAVRDIAKVLDRSPATVSREIRRNRYKIWLGQKVLSGSYKAKQAQHKAYVRRRYAKFQWKKINQNQSLRTYIVIGLMRSWSPDEISGRLRKEKHPFYASKTAIYDWLRCSDGVYWCQYLYSRRYRPRKRKQGQLKKILIPDRIGVELRPEYVNCEYGHCEADTMLSGRKTGSKTAVVIACERKTKYFEARKIKTLSPANNNSALKQIQETIVVKSLTLDNGIENTKYKELGVATYFCRPYSAWQKGRVENVIKLLRRFMPKGSDLSCYSEAYIRDIVNLLNHKPRKSLDYKTPHEVMVENNLLKIPSVALEG